MSSTDSHATIPEPARKLDALLGTWAVSGTMTMGDGAARVSGRWRFSRVADGYGVRTALQTTIEGMGTFEEEELIGFDPSEERIHFFSLNKFAVRDHVGGWKDDHTLYVEYNGEQQGEHCREGMTITLAGDRMEGHVVETLAGVVVVTTALTLVKQP